MSFYSRYAVYHLPDGRHLCTGKDLLPTFSGNQDVSTSPLIESYNLSSRKPVGVFNTDRENMLIARFLDAVIEGFVLISESAYILGEPEAVMYECDFIGPGGFPCFYKEEDAKVAAELFTTPDFPYIAIKSQKGDFWSVD